MTKLDVASERKAQIVQATVECISKYGYNNFSMQDVANAAGVSKGIIHYYFLNKDDLLKSVLDKVAEDIEKAIVSETKKAKNPREKLEMFIEVGLNVVRKNKEYYQVNMDFWTQINQNTDIRAVIGRHYAKFRETASQILAEGVKDGSFKDVNLIGYASIIIAVMDGISLQWLFDDSVFSYEKIIEKTKNLILSGLTPHNVSASGSP